MTADELKMELANLVSRMDLEESARKDMKNQINALRTDVGELLYILRTAKAAVDTFSTIGRLLRYIGSLAMYIGAIWALVYAIRHPEFIPGVVTNTEPSIAPTLHSHIDH